MVEVVALVELIEVLGKTYAGPAVWELDARWAIVVVIESVVGDAGDAAALLEPTKRIAFAAHSPTHVFARVCDSENVVGVRWRFELQPTGDRTWRVLASGHA